MLTTQQAADRLGISRSGVYHRIALGYIRAERHGTDYAIDESQLAIQPRRGRPPKQKPVSKQDRIKLALRAIERRAEPKHTERKQYYDDDYPSIGMSELD